MENKLVILGLDGLDKFFVDRYRDELDNFDRIADDSALFESSSRQILIS